MVEYIFNEDDWLSMEDDYTKSYSFHGRRFIVMTEFHYNEMMDMIRTGAEVMELLKKRGKLNGKNTRRIKKAN